LKTAVDDGSKVGEQAVVDADILEEFGICHYIQVMVQQRDCLLVVALDTSLLLHAAAEDCFCVDDWRDSVVVCNCDTSAEVQVHVDMVDEQ
jgi:hypothetical protein